MFYEVENLPADVTFSQLDSIVNFALNYLEIDTDDTILINFDEDLEPHQCGYFDYEEDDGELYISISHALRGEEMVRTIMHELVHARQILTGLYVPGEGKVPGTWAGIEYSCEYKDLPWEIEAYALEEAMFTEYEGIE